MKKPVHIECRRWFQKTCGNTYFSAYVTFDDGSTETITKFSYGYGDHCLSESLVWLGKNGYAQLPERHANGAPSYNTTVFLREVLHCDYEVSDVNRKKDM